MKANRIRRKDMRPLLRGFVIEGGRRIAVHCPFCDAFHHHGWDSEAKKPEYRVGHCTSHEARERMGSSGYWIAPYTKTSLKEEGILVKQAGEPG